MKKPVLVKIAGKLRNVSGWLPDRPDHRDIIYRPYKFITHGLADDFWTMKEETGLPKVA